MSDTKSRERNINRGRIDKGKVLNPTQPNLLKLLRNCIHRPSRVQRLRKIPDPPSKTISSNPRKRSLGLPLRCFPPNHKKSIRSYPVRRSRSLIIISFELCTLSHRGDAELQPTWNRRDTVVDKNMNRGKLGIGAIRSDANFDWMIS